MPTSDGSRDDLLAARERTRTIVLRLAFAVTLLSLAVLANALLTLVLVPYGSKSEIAWTDYAAQEDVDCLVVGTSTAMSGIDPAVIDRRLGAHSFNLATPSQLLDESFLAVRTAHEDHGITRVVLSLSHSQVMRSSSPNPGSAFMHQRSRVVSTRQRLEGLSYLLLDGGAAFQPSSLNMAFPWVSNKVSDSLGAIAKNALMKLDGTTLYEAAETNERGWTYQGRGFGYYTSTLDFNGRKAQSYFTLDNPEDVGVEAGNASHMDEDRARALGDLCDYCAHNGIELVAVAPPLPDFTLVEYGEDYFALGDEIKAFVERRGGHYVDFNRVDPALFSSKEAYFHDSTHLTLEGAEAFTEAVCDAVLLVEAGDDPSGGLLSADERLGAIERISCVFVDAASQPEGIRLMAHAMVGPSVDVEYRFCVWADGDWRVVRDWSGDASLLYLPEGGRRGEVRVRASARAAGGDAEGERHRELVAMY